MKLLLINKNPVVSRMMLMSVPKAGFEIEECESVYDLPTGVYEVVILDDEMYDENFLHDIKQNIKYYQLGLITSSKDIDTSQFDFVLSKPFLPTDLIEVLREVKEKIENQKRHAPIFEEEESKEPFEQFLSEESESIVQIEEKEEESPFVSEPLEKSGILNNSELEEVTTLLDEKEEPAESFLKDTEPVIGLKEESVSGLAEEPVQESLSRTIPSIEEEIVPKSILKESLQEREVELEEAKKERFLDEIVEAKEEQIESPGLEQKEEKIDIELSQIGIDGLRKLLDGMRLDITVKISFPDEKNV